MSDDHRLGHRERLKERFRKGGANALAEYELLELALMLAIPRRDVKPLAKTLLAEFGNYAEVISAPPERLKEISGVGDNVVTTLKIVEASSQKLAQSKVLEKPVLSNWQALINYCSSEMAYKKNEQFRVLFLDRKNRLIADVKMQEGTIDHTPVYPREIIKKALELGSTAIILVHNHPSGDPTPSREDIEMTKKIMEAGKQLGVILHDHLIISKGGHSSFKSLDLI
ncbi:RadC family protein [Pseudemcibacter aquimaris]|uniref:RadC family protein n=1 Tax=Pseudemcibacter aquimaris TaxID=2857064 RepID=UPI00201232E1|nr:DNA repair protein RadC [Pseudemcibacter aquimaris]MCC3860622.1 DNA repair protein RadC [Pseudemcibacter aquimaris]WDU59441.1 DNA repair protein RadC [Pseudemcibacter aquimaris]